MLTRSRRKSWVGLPERDASELTVLLGDTSLGRYNRNPRMRVQKAENVNKALEFITSRGVKLTNIGPEGSCISLISGFQPYSAFHRHH